MHKSGSVMEGQLLITRVPIKIDYKFPKVECKTHNLTEIPQILHKAVCYFHPAFNTSGQWFLTSGCDYTEGSSNIFWWS